MEEKASAPAIYPGPEGPGGYLYPNQPATGYPGQQVDPGLAYNPVQQTMGPGVQVANTPPYQSYPAQAPPQPQPQVSQQQMSSNNVVVVTQQPATIPTTVHVTHSDQSSLIFALVISLIAFFCGCWWTLFCSIPGIVLGHMASEAGSRGDVATKRKYDKISVGLTVSGIICEVAGPIIIAVAAGVAITSGAAAASRTVFG